MGRDARPRLELADIVRAHGDDYRRAHYPSAGQQAVLEHIVQCRTAVLGGHLDACDSCGVQRISYNSCRDRHCPKCQSTARAQWVTERLERLLPYLTVSPTELTISALVTLGVLGCCALIAAGLCQARAKAENRRLPLAVLGLVGFGYAAGSALGFAGAQVARGARAEPTGLPSALHGAGFMLGIVLCVLVFAEFGRMGSLGALRPRRGRSDPVS